MERGEIIVKKNQSVSVYPSILQYGERKNENVENGEKNYGLHGD